MEIILDLSRQMDILQQLVLSNTMLSPTKPDPKSEEEEDIQPPSITLIEFLRAHVSISEKAVDILEAKGIKDINTFMVLEPENLDMTGLTLMEKKFLIFLVAYLKSTDGLLPDVFISISELKKTCKVKAQPPSKSAEPLQPKEEASKFKIDCLKIPL